MRIVITALLWLWFTGIAAAHSLAVNFHRPLRKSQSRGASSSLTS